MSWEHLETGAPALGRAAHTLIERAGFIYLGTLRRDGTPRISPVEAHIVRRQLMLVMVAGSRKVRDLERDPRVTLQSPVTDAGDPGSELKLRGRVAEVGAAQRDATAAAVEAASGWRPRPSWRCVAVDVEWAALLVWEHGELVLSRWDRDRGVRPTARLRLVAEGSTDR